MDFKLADLLTHNHAPAAEVVTSVKNLLVGPMKRLEEIQAEIERHERTLAALREEANTVTKSMEDYNTIISPVRRVPEDVLLAIFHECLPAHRNPVMSSSEAPMLLTHVCSTWRSLVLDSPTLWARIHITFSDEDRLVQPNQLPSTDRHASADLDTVKAMQSRCNRVEEWLSHAQACPLSISIHYESRTWHSQIDETEDLTLRLFKIVCRHARQWSSIEVTGLPYPVFLRMDKLIAHDELPMLSQLKLGINHLPGASDYQQHALNILEAPNLRSVSLYMPKWKLSEPRLSSTWPTITYLCLHNPSPVREIFSVLQICQNLVHCKFYLEDFSGSESATGIAVLNHLRYLHIFEEASHQMATHLYSAIYAPHIQRLIYQKHLYDPGELEDKSVQSPILLLLRQASGLKKLTLEPKALSKANTLRALQALPSLTHLVIGSETPIFPRPFASRSANFSRVYRRSPANERFNLKILSIPSPNQPFPSLSFSSVGDPIDPPGILLPKLEVFETTESEAAPIISDATLKEFITSRLYSYSKGEVAPLRRVRATFDRARTEDIGEDVRRHANAVGVDLTLEVDYLPPATSKPQVPLSPNYLLQDSRAPTWPHTEFEEYVC
ncbi:hypothetical protein JR316_0012295 [Psilocybe cubensis]|uniref:Uncharacterized protein n=2 Tax=Psilocybe cubensis TaxID=181762 RepID=A0ACB8GI62_PSICU|nr:hypothetical protein JR316_0012295 [Psilocybe cubensis]KAH9475184.1 hypothetical protein JR316_0012295 [Psilocybe cubensis]